MATRDEIEASKMAAAEQLWMMEKKVEEVAVGLGVLSESVRSCAQSLSLPKNKTAQAFICARRVDLAAIQLSSCLQDLHDASTAALLDAGETVPLSGGGNKTDP